MRRLEWTTPARNTTDPERIWAADETGLWLDGELIGFPEVAREMLSNASALAEERRLATIAVERLLFALSIYPNYRLDSRGPSGCLLEAIEHLRPDLALRLRDDIEPSVLLDELDGPFRRARLPASGAIEAGHEQAPLASERARIRREFQRYLRIRVGRLTKDWFTEVLDRVVPEEE